MRVGGIESVKNTDARQVIVIGRQDPNDVPPSFLFVRTIGERDAIITNRIVVVRQAYLGDPTVVKGWAAYVLDKTTEPYKWMKLIEQESVDGPWGINEEIKKNLVTKATFIQQINAINKRLNDLGDISTVIGQAHTHNNKKQLDLISTIGDIQTPTHDKKFSVALTVNGKLANDTYYYECFAPEKVEEGTTIPASLAWMNPIDGGTYTRVSSSADIADRFARSESCMRIMFHGCKLAVRELDGTLSLYTFNQLGPSSYNAEFIGSLCGEANTRKAVTFVDALPTPSETVSHGYYCVPALNAYFECKQSNGTWKWNELGLSVATGVQASIVACFRSNWNNCTVVFKQQSDVEVFETTVVRKFHSPSSSINDGVKVATVKGGSGAVTDVCPVSDTEVYYTVFQRLMDGSTTEPASSQADYLGWDDVALIIQSGLFPDTFKDGDIVTLEHEVFGAIPCVVRNSNVNGCTLVATKSIINLEFDGSEHGYVKTSDTTYKRDKVYYTFEVSEVNGVYKEQYVNIPNPTIGATITGTVFEAVVNTAAYDDTNKVRHGNRNWSSSNLQQWLASDDLNEDYSWFKIRDQFDALGKSYEVTSKTKKGFLAGFVDENLRDLIRNVRIPSSAVEVYTSGYVWTTETSNTYDLVVRKKNYSDGEGPLDIPPEGSDRIWDGTSSYTATLYGVAPVFEIALPEESS